MSYDCCYCDYDAPSFYSSRIQRSRRARHCEECGHKIQPGELYEYVAGKWEGSFESHITCGQCHDMRVWCLAFVALMATWRTIVVSQLSASLKTTRRRQKGYGSRCSVAYIKFGSVYQRNGRRHESRQG